MRERERDSGLLSSCALSSCYGNTYLELKPQGDQKWHRVQYFMMESLLGWLSQYLPLPQITGKEDNYELLVTICYENKAA